MAQLPAPLIRQPAHSYTTGSAPLFLSRKPALWRTCLSLALFWPLLLAAADRAQSAREYKRQLAEKIMPYWYDTAVDRQYGGYLLSDDAAKKAPPATEKQLVTQSRMVWGFAHAHRKGLSTANRNYLKAAEQGYRFLLAHFLDTENGGYYWTTDPAGKPLNQHKIVYGEAFVIYAFVEYYRASHDQEALKRAMDLYQVLQRRAHDREHDGWIEHFERDWTPMLKPSPEAIVEVGGMKSANTHLHLMEAMTELYDATHDPEVRKSLEEAVKINATCFYPREAGQSRFHRHLDWKPATEPSSAGLSYGHNVEFAWLFIRAQGVLGERLSWDHFNAHIEHALKYGYDHQRGGLYSRGKDDQPATDTDKVWWVQAEMLAALTDALQHKQVRAYSEALDKLVDFIFKYQANPADAIWLDTVAAGGTPKNTAKAHSWKANYHDVRAMVKFVEAFGGGF
jgi:cellobiose epimerase